MFNKLKKINNTMEKQIQKWDDQENEAETLSLKYIEEHEHLD